MNKAFLIGWYKDRREKDACQESLEELASLCTTYGIAETSLLNYFLRQFDPKTCLGKGKIDEVKMEIESQGFDCVICDEEISPQQQKHLHAIFKVPVLDRSELILGVFAKRAQTREARLQIELAELEYQLPRLRRLWTHLSRQRGSGGSGGYLKGEGEKQIEIDKQILKRKIVQVKKEIDVVIQQRNVQRHQRERSSIPIFSIVGYTNAGKSTLFNRLTGAHAFVENQLFATLDPMTRRMTLPNSTHVLITDTVGFIRKIPHLLIAAFRSTLEESIHADALIHVVDASHPAATEQAETTRKVLEELGGSTLPTLTVLNKIDQADPDALFGLRLKFAPSCLISAKTGEGVEGVKEWMEKMTGQEAHDE